MQDWSARFDRLERSSILQSYPYAQAVAATKGQKPRWGLIKMNGHEAGLVQIFEASLFWKALHAVMLDRGPLWFEGFGGAAHVKLFFDHFNAQYAGRFGRMRRILPELEDSPAAQSLIAQTGLRQKENEAGYQTIWLDLRRSEEDLRAALKKNWRGSLNKAERAGLQLEIDTDMKTLPFVVSSYAVDKQSRGYGGANPKFLKMIATYFAKSRNCMILNAFDGKECLAWVLILTHGRSATYQAGWSSDHGRTKNAHHLLLWRAITVLKEQDIQDFDLGGMNDKTAKGVLQFKSGLGGNPSQLVGHYF